jgi:hypothetical protein
MKLIHLLISIIFVCANASAAVVKSHDLDRSCTLYQAITPDQDGHVVLSAGQKLVSSKNVYGLSFIDMEVNFDRKEVLIQPMMNIVLGFNKELIAHKAVIKEGNADFGFLINQLNRKLLLFEKICIGAGNEVIYAHYFPAPENN